MESPGTQLTEVQKLLSQQLLFSIDVSTICRFLLKIKFTYQKLSLVATQRSAFLRQKFMLDVSEYKQEMLVFIDETGTDSRKALRSHGYSLHGVPSSKVPQAKYSMYQDLSESSCKNSSSISSRSCTVLQECTCDMISCKNIILKQKSC